jgi:hypothetical protein
MVAAMGVPGVAVPGVVVTRVIVTRVAVTRVVVPVLVVVVVGHASLWCPPGIDRRAGADALSMRAAGRVC